MLTAGDAASTFTGARKEMWKPLIALAQIIPREKTIPLTSKAGTLAQQMH